MSDREKATAFYLIAMTLFILHWTFWNRIVDWIDLKRAQREINKTLRRKK